MRSAKKSVEEGKKVPEEGAVACKAVNASKLYGEADTAVHALDGVDVSFAAGQFTSIMGPSGSGKSTLMHCLAGLDQLTSGDVYFGSTRLSSLGDTQRTNLRRDRIGFVFQAFNLIPTLTAKENILLPSNLAGSKVDAQWLDQIVSTVGLGDRLEHKPNELSGGQQQRVAVARAVANKPDVIFADEPTGNLDSTAGQSVLQFLQSAVQSLGQTIVMVTHDATAASYADRVVFLQDGSVVDDIDQPTPQTVLTMMTRLGDTNTADLHAVTGAQR